MTDNITDKVFGKRNDKVIQQYRDYAAYDTGNQAVNEYFNSFYFHDRLIIWNKIYPKHILSCRVSH